MDILTQKTPSAENVIMRRVPVRKRKHVELATIAHVSLGRGVYRGAEHFTLQDGDIILGFSEDVYRPMVQFSWMMIRGGKLLAYFPRKYRSSGTTEVPLNMIDGKGELHPLRAVVGAKLSPISQEPNMVFGFRYNAKTKGVGMVLEPRPRGEGIRTLLDEIEESSF